MREFGSRKAARAQSFKVFHKIAMQNFGKIHPVNIRQSFEFDIKGGTATSEEFPYLHRLHSFCRAKIFLKHCKSLRF